MFQPQRTLKEGDLYKTQIEIASEIITELVNFGFQIELVLADSLYGESSLFISTLDKFELAGVLAIRSNHGVWMPNHQKVRANKWCKFERVFSNQESETRYIREIIFGKRTRRTYWEVTTAPETMPETSTLRLPSTPLRRCSELIEETSRSGLTVSGLHPTALLRLASSGVEMSRDTTPFGHDRGKPLRRCSELIEETSRAERCPEALVHVEMSDALSISASSMFHLRCLELVVHVVHVDPSTSFVMTNLTEKRSQIKKTLGHLYGLRTWVEYGFRQCQQERGWTDYRLTSFQDISCVAAKFNK